MRASHVLGVVALVAPVLAVTTSTASTSTASTSTASSCHGLRATIVGTDKRDRIVGTDGPDVIVALKGDDRVIARGGDDVVCGGRGADRLAGGAGADHLFGQGGRRKQLDEFTVYIGNLLDGGSGRDVLYAGQRSQAEYPQDWPPNRVAFRSATGGVSVDLRSRTARGPGIGQDRLVGQFRRVIGTRYADTLVSARDAELVGRGGDDTLTMPANAAADMSGDRGDDRLTYAGPAYGQATGGPGDDTLVSHRGYSVLDGGRGADTVRAGGGTDYTFGGPGDTLSLGAGHDQVVFSASSGPAAKTDAGPGRDLVVVMPDRGARVVADLAAGTLSLDGVKATVSSYESIATSPLAGPTRVASIVVRGSEAANRIEIGWDIFGRIRVDGAAGNDDIDLSTTNDATHGAHVHGGHGDDRIAGTDAADVLVGGGGIDRVNGRDGRDVCSGEHLLSCESRPRD